MAKLTNCQICGKEITKGIFKGEDETLYISNDKYITCCPDCYKQYKSVAKQLKDNFTVKLANHKLATKHTPKGQELVDLYINYVNEALQYLAKQENSKSAKQGYFYQYTDSGVFGWTERQMGFMGGDVTARDKIKALEKNFECDALCFTKDDISCIEYCLCQKQPLSLFKDAFSVEICLNQTNGITFKPCYGKTVLVVSGLLSTKKKAIRETEKMLTTFKNNIGSELPITKVKKFKFR